MNKNKNREDSEGKEKGSGNCQETKWRQQLSTGASERGLIANKERREKIRNKKKEIEERRGMI